MHQQATTFRGAGPTLADVGDLIEHVAAPALVLDGDQRILFWNDAACKLLGYTADEVRGRYWDEVVAAVLPDGQPVGPSPCAPARGRGRRPTYWVRRCMARRRDGHRVAVGLSELALPDDAGALSSRQGIAIIVCRPLDQAVSRPAVDQPLRIFTFGRFALAVGGHPVELERWPRKQAISLLKHLVTRRGLAVHRERLMSWLWPDTPEAQARDRLKVVVSDLRRQLVAAGLDQQAIMTTGQCYALRTDAVWIDAAAFEQLIAEGTRLERAGTLDDALHRFEDARALYQGDFLEEDPHPEWCAHERDRLREIHLELLTRLADLYTNQERYVDAVEICGVALMCEPRRESFYRTLMECLARLGRRDAVIAQYERCKAILAREMGVEPAPETERLYRSITQSWRRRTA